MSTIYTVAKAAGVSPKTVSRVINRDVAVSARTRQTVEAAMSALGYVPSNAARMMRSSKSGLIGIITGAVSQGLVADRLQGLPDLLIVQGLQSVFSDQEMTAMIADTGGKTARVPHLIRTFLAHKVEAIVLIAEHHKKVDPDLSGLAVPALLVNAFDDEGTPAILPDDAHGQEVVAARLLAEGHKRIAYLTLATGLIATPLRLAGYRAALAAVGLEFDPALVVAGEEFSAAGDLTFMGKALDRLLGLAEPPSAIMCGNDEMAMSVYGLLRARGRNPGQNISVAGYDDHRSIAENLYPPLSTVELPYRAMGARGAERIMAALRGGAPLEPGPEMVRGGLKWRASTRRNP